MTFKRLICKIFGHRLGGWHKSVEYVRMGNGLPYGKRTTKRVRKKKIVRIFCKCKRCGAMIMVSKYKENR